MWWLILLAAAWLAVVGYALYLGARDFYESRANARFVASKRRAWPADRGLV